MDVGGVLVCVVGLGYGCLHRLACAAMGHHLASHIFTVKVPVFGVTGHFSNGNAVEGDGVNEEVGNFQGHLLIFALLLSSHLFESGCPGFEKAAKRLTELSEGILDSSLVVLSFVCELLKDSQVEVDLDRLRIGHNSTLLHGSVLVEFYG